MLAGITTFRNWAFERMLAPELLLGEGDRRAVIAHMQFALENRCKEVTLDHDLRLQPLFEKALAVLRDLESRGVTIFFRHRPRKLNKVADELTKRARQQRTGTFHDDVFFPNSVSLIGF